MNQQTEDKAQQMMSSEIVKNYVSNAFRIVMGILAFAGIKIFNDLSNNVKDLKDEIHVVSESVHGVKEKLVDLEGKSVRNRADIEEIKEFNARVHRINEKD